MWVDVVLVLAWLAALVARMESADRERNDATRLSIDRILRDEASPKSGAFKRIADQPKARENIVIAVHRKTVRPVRKMARVSDSSSAPRGRVPNPEMGMRVFE